MSSYRQGVACTSAPFPLPLPFAPHLLPLPRLELCTALEVAVKLPTATVLPLCASPGACSRPYFSRAPRIASLQPAPNKPAVPAAACSASTSAPPPRAGQSHAAARHMVDPHSHYRNHDASTAHSAATPARPRHCLPPVRHQSRVDGPPVLGRYANSLQCGEPRQCRRSAPLARRVSMACAEQTCRTNGLRALPSAPQHRAVQAHAAPPPLLSSLQRPHLLPPSHEGKRYDHLL